MSVFGINKMYYNSYFPSTKFIGFQYDTYVQGRLTPVFIFKLEFILQPQFTENRLLKRDISMAISDGMAQLRAASGNYGTVQPPTHEVRRRKINDPASRKSTLYNVQLIVSLELFRNYYTLSMSRVQRVCNKEKNLNFISTLLKLRVELMSTLLQFYNQCYSEQ